MVPRIQISQIPARLQVSQGPARVYTQNRTAQVSIRSSDPQVSVRSGVLEMEINWRATRNDMGYEDYMTFQRSFRNDSLQAGLAGIARIAGEGGALGQIENGGHPVADMAMARTDHEKSFNIGFIPLEPVDITFTPRQPRLEGAAPEVNVRVNTYPALHRVTPTPVQVQVEPKGEVNIDFVGQFVDLLVE